MRAEHALAVCERRSKGETFATTYIIAPETFPNQKAISSGTVSKEIALKQERNLMYVAHTRATNNLFILTSVIDADEELNPNSDVKFLAKG